MQHLPSEVLSDPTHHLPRIRAFERDEIVRILTQPGTTMRRAAEELGMSRATLYRKMSQYGIRCRVTATAPAEARPARRRGQDPARCARRNSGGR